MQYINKRRGKLIRNVLKLVGEIISISVLSGLASLIYWKLVVYYGFPKADIFRWQADGEGAYDCLFFEIFLIFSFLSAVIFCTSRAFFSCRT